MALRLPGREQGGRRMVACYEPGNGREVTMQSRPRSRATPGGTAMDFEHLTELRLWRIAF